MPGQTSCGKLTSARMPLGLHTLPLSRSMRRNSLLSSSTSIACGRCRETSDANAIMTLDEARETHAALGSVGLTRLDYEAL